MKKSIQLNLFICVVAALFLTMQHNSLLAGTQTAQKIESVNQTGDPSIATSRSDIKNLSLSIDAVEKFLKKLPDPTISGGINKSRMNIKSLTIALDKLESSEGKKRIPALKTMRTANETLEASIMELHKLIASKYASHAADIKAKYDAVKNSINSIKK